MYVHMCRCCWSLGVTTILPRTPLPRLRCIAPLLGSGGRSLEVLCPGQWRKFLWLLSTTESSFSVTSWFVSCWQSNNDFIWKVAWTIRIMRTFSSFQNQRKSGQKSGKCHNPVLLALFLLWALTSIKIIVSRAWGSEYLICYFRAKALN